MEHYQQNEHVISPDTYQEEGGGEQAEGNNAVLEMLHVSPEEARMRACQELVEEIEYIGQQVPEADSFMHNGKEYSVHDTDPIGTLYAKAQRGQALAESVLDSHRQNVMETNPQHV